MSDISSQNDWSGIGGPSAATPTPTGSEKTTTPTGLSPVSTLTKSELEAELEAIIASMPQPIPPEKTNIEEQLAAISAADRAREEISWEVQKVNSEEINKMVENWADSVREESRQQKKDDELKLWLRHIDAQMEQPSVNLFAVPMMPITTAEIDNTIIRISQNVESSPDAGNKIASLLAPFVVVGSSIVNEATSVINPVNVSGTRESLQFIGSVFPGDAPVDLSMLGALLINTMPYQSMVSVAAEELQTDKKSDKPIDERFALQYANDIINLCVNGKFDSFVRNRFLSKTNLPTERQEQMLAFLKVVLLSTPLILLYKLQTGKMTDLEFAGMLKTPQQGVRSRLVDLFNTYLQMLPPADRENAVNAILSYADSDPNLDHLVDPAKVFDSINKLINPAEIQA